VFSFVLSHSGRVYCEGRVFHKSWCLMLFRLQSVKMIVLFPSFGPVIDSRLDILRILTNCIPCELVKDLLKKQGARAVRQEVGRVHKMVSLPHSKEFCLRLYCRFQTVNLVTFETKKPCCGSTFSQKHRKLTYAELGTYRESPNLKSFSSNTFSPRFRQNPFSGFSSLHFTARHKSAAAAPAPAPAG
jgi:hypothetical protein